jgi:hypothetical protein
MRKSVIVLVTVCLAAAFGMVTSAYAPDQAGPSANGTFQFTAGDGSVRYVSFNARIHKDNTVTGEMTYTDPDAAPETDTDNPETSIATTGLSVKANFDCLVINGNRATMSGVIVESNIGAAVGRRVLLVVEDNEQGSRASDLDKLSWGVYKPNTMNWTPADAELENDLGATLRWTATDYERTDDVGIPSHRDPTIGCQSFPLSSYSFLNIEHGAGNIQVKP